MVFSKVILLLVLFNSFSFVCGLCSYETVDPIITQPTIPGANFDLPDYSETEITGFRFTERTCTKGDPIDCYIYDLGSYNASVADDVTTTDPYFDQNGFFATEKKTDRNFFLVQHTPATDTLPQLYNGETVQYRIKMLFRQHASNQVKNEPIVLPEITLQVYLMSNLTLESLIDSYVDFSIHSPEKIMVDNNRVNYVESITSSTTWENLEWSFTLADQDCLECRLVVMIRHNNGVPNPGNAFFFGNLTLEYDGIALPIQTDNHVSSHPIINLPVMPALPSPYPARTNCPHLTDRSSLKLWHDAASWGSGGSVPAAGATVTLPENTKMLLQGCSLGSTEMTTPFERITVPATSSLIFDDANITLAAKSIVVYGELLAGSTTCRLFSHITITLHGAKPAGTTSSMTDKAIAVFGGTIDLHGKEYYTWSRLARTAYAGMDRLYLQEAVNWEPGQRVVVPSTLFELSEQLDEVVTVKAVSPSGKLVWLHETLAQTHYGGPEYQGEAGLLSRRIVIRGNEADSLPGEFGGHMVVTNSSGVAGIGRFSGVATQYMGQKNFLARYPFHYHVIGSSPDSFIRDCSIENSFYRGVVIHGTHNVTLTRTVAHNINGHCYYLEDGIEEDNTLSFNLVSGVKTIYIAAAGPSQNGEVFVESDDLRNPADTSASGFYITNTWNVIQGNVAAGGWSGFAFVNLPYPINMHRGLDFSDTFRNPENRMVKKFQGNTAHSSSSQWNRGGCMYVGGELKHLNNGLLQYISGRIRRETLELDGSEGWMRIEDTLTFACTRGFNHWGKRADVVRFEAYDILRGIVLFGEAYLNQAQITGSTGNNAFLNMDQHIGFQFYDTATKTILDNVTFVGYNISLNDHVIEGLVIKDNFKPQGINLANNIVVKNSSRESIIYMNENENGASWLYNVFDADGSLSQRGKPTIIGSREEWWRYSDDSNVCERDLDWDVWMCDVADRSVVSVEIHVFGLTRDENFPDTSDLLQFREHIGYVSLLGRPNSKIKLTKNPTTTGFSRETWVTDFFLGSPQNVMLNRIQVPKNQWFVLAIPYPEQTNITVELEQPKRGGPVNFTIPEASSLNDLYSNLESPWPNTTTCPEPVSFCSSTTGTGPLWYYNGTMLFVRLVDPSYYASKYVDDPMADFRRGKNSDLVLNDINNDFNIHIQASCDMVCGSASQACFNPRSALLPNNTVDLPMPQEICSVEPVSLTSLSTQNGGGDPDSAPSSSSSSSGLIIGAGAGAGALVLVAAVALVMVKRSSRSRLKRNSVASSFTA